MKKRGIIVSSLMISFFTVVILGVEFYNQGILADEIGTTPEIIVGSALLANMQLVLFAVAVIAVPVSIILLVKDIIKAN